MEEFKITERFTPTGGRSFSRYLREVEKYKVLTSDQEFDLVQKFKEGDEAAWEKIINSNLRFVISVAKSYSQDPDLFVELVAAGNMGLVDALKKFDHTKGFRFISYAVWHIRKEILQFLSENSRTIRIPINKVQELRAVEETEIALLAELGRTPTMEEGITRLEEKNDQRFKNYNHVGFQAMMVADKKIQSLDSKVSSESDSITWGEIVASEDDAPDLEASNDSSSQFLMKFVKQLHPVDREIVLRHHGFREYNIEEGFLSIANSFGISVESARQRYAKSIKQLKILARRKKLTKTDFLTD